MARPPKRDAAQAITDRIIKELEEGVPPWKKPWDAGGAALRPIRHNGDPYRGINTLLLCDEACARGFENPRWMTLKQANGLGAQVRKGARSALVVYYGEATKSVERLGAEEDSEETFRFLKAYRVFNVDEIADLPPDMLEYAGQHLERVPPPSERRAFFDAIGADIRHGGHQAFYNRGGDYIQMPRYGDFPDPEKYFATLAHELAHLSGSPGRLNREKGKRFGDHAYAFEELVAEISALMVGLEINLRPDHLYDHSAYIESWLKALESDKRFILKAASEAQKATDWILGQARHRSPEAVVEVEMRQAA